MSAHVSSGKQTRLDTISYQAFCIFFFIKSVTCWVLSSYISSCRTTLSTTSALQKKALKIELFLRWPVTTLQHLVHVESTRWSHTLPVNFHPRQFCLQLNAPYLRRFRAPISVGFSLSAAVNTLVFFFFFTSWAQLAYFILYIQFKCHEFKSAAPARGPHWSRMGSSIFDERISVKVL